MKTSNLLNVGNNNSNGYGRSSQSSAIQGLTKFQTGLSISAIDRDIFTIVGHNSIKGNWIVVTSNELIGIEASIVEVIDADNVRLDIQIPDSMSVTFPSLCDFYRIQTAKLAASGELITSFGTRTVVDNIDSPQGPSMVPTGANLIPRSSNNALQVVASLAASCTAIQSVSDVGEFINVYSDAARTQFLGHLPLTPDELLDVDIPAGTAIFLGAAKDIDIDDATSIIQLNFIG